jgi:heavy metal sensor kinase
VGEVAHELAKVSGSNLSLRVPLRGSGDELDLMINSFNSMVSRLETSFQQIRQFSTDVSHELRTPITVVRGQLEVALMTSRSEEDLRAAIENALPDFDRLSAIVRALLQLAKAESGQLQLQMADVDLAALVREVMDELDLPAMDKQITLHHLVPPTVVISGDRIQLERLLYNLIDNAIKYTPSGGEIDVSVNTIPEDAFVQLIVRDNGVGIAPEHLPHLFDRFYRVPDKEGSIEKGLGLGLSFVSWIVKAHNGKIDVESEVGKGTVFTVSFPWAPAESKTLIEHGNQRETAGRSLYS